MLNAHRDNRIKNLFCEALELEPDARETYLDSQTIDDPTIRVDVIKLIDSHNRAARFMIDPTISETAGAFAASGKIGPYTLLRLIGEGGFGSVFLAQQHKPMARQVALKIIKPGMDTRLVIARFEAERQTLAMMKHPNIATVFDAGATDAGRPYFVMEFVDGVSITEYCDRHSLSIEQRLNLFMEVCGAVQHAHAKGVIHRDLKPSNLMVTMHDDVPLPKIIDFGVAKATSEQSSHGRDQTEAGKFVGTPQYMSPEQACNNAIDIDTRSDVYSLGVVLYELLAGVTPFDSERLRTEGISDWQRIIRDEEPPKPSTRLSSLNTLAEIAACRGVLPARLANRVSGDLDWITLKALEKDRDRRYGSAAELAADITRHLHDEPVLARPPSKLYLATKFIRRHRVGVLASTLVALAIAGGSIGLAVGTVRARESAQQARTAAHEAQAINDFMRQILTSVNPEQQGADVRLVEVMNDASAIVSQQFSGHPMLEAQVRDLLGSVFYDLSVWGKAKAEFKKAMELWQANTGRDDARAIASEQLYVGSAINHNQFAEVAQRLPNLAQRANRIFGPDHLTTLDVQRAIALTHLLAGRADEAERLLLDIRARLKASSDDDHLHIQLLRNLIRVKRIKSYNTNREAQAVLASQMEVLAHERVERALRAFGPHSLVTFECQLGLAGVLADRHQHEVAAQTCRDVLDAVAGKVSECHILRMEAFYRLATSLHRLGDSATAADLHLQMIDCAREGGDALTLLVTICDALPILDRGERWTEGEALAQEYARSLEGMGGGHDDMLFNAEIWVARFVSLQGRFDDAESMFLALINRSGQDFVGKSTHARLLLFHGGNLWRRGDFAASETEIQAAANELNDFRLGTNNLNPDDVLIEFVLLYSAWGKVDQAAEYEKLLNETLANLPIDPR